MNKDDGFECAEYFTFNIAQDADFRNDCQRRAIPQLTEKLNRASLALGGSGGATATMSCLDPAHFCFCRTRLDGRASLLLYFSDLLKGLIYIRTGTRTFEIYYFSFGRTWSG
jgi:hypothetical protein